MINKRNIIIATASLLIASMVFLYLRSSENKEEGDLLVEVKKGQFVVDITTTGELEAKNSVKIQGPIGLRIAGVWNVKIEKLVEEGRVVKKGDVVAELDKSELTGKISNSLNELQKIESQYLQTQLDTTLTLRQARDELTNLQYTTQEKKLILEQSKYEPPASIRQAEIELEKAERAYQQAKQNYTIKKDQSKAKMQEVAATKEKAERNLNDLQSVLKDLTVLAPESGMVVYEREWNGQRRATGSSIGPWDPTVATLPDLSVMLSKTYVNEVDIRKIKVGQLVNVGLDAFPDKKLTGKVITVANMGEQKPNSDAKVFQVDILINESDTTLRPAMTTGNSIIAEIINDVMFIPLECIHNQGDSISYVYKKQGISFVKQQVDLGTANSNEIIVKRGLEFGDKIYLSIPKGNEGKEVVLLESEKPTITAK
jgi:HlyD family secretion protein